jgi:hypothetical protein
MLRQQKKPHRITNHPQRAHRLAHELPSHLPQALLQIRKETNERLPAAEQP